MKQVIEENSGKVDYWFPTHYYADHVSAFDALYSEYRDKIGTVYVYLLDWEKFEPRAKDWNYLETLRLFVDQAADADNLMTLYKGNELDIDGVHIKVLSFFDEHMRVLSTDWSNDSSLVLKMQFAGDYILFLGDLCRMPSLGEYLVDTYSGELRANYV